LTELTELRKRKVEIWLIRNSGSQEGTRNHEIYEIHKRELNDKATNSKTRITRINHENGEVDFLRNSGNQERG
jgi:hypothetical protein